MHAANLQADDIAYLLLIERLEHDDFIDTVEELGSDGLPQHLHDLRLGGLGVHAFLLVLADELAAEVGGEDDKGVLEVHRPPFVVGQSPVVQHLQQHIEHIGMGFLYLVEEHHAVGFASDGFGELSALVVAHISRRCTDESGG